VAIAVIAGRVPQALAAGHWEAYFKLARAARHAGLVESQTLPDEQTAAMKAHLVETLRRDPYDARANLRLAAVYLREFDARQGKSENPMPLSQIRDAALASHFPTREVQDGWLSAVLGDNRRLLDAALVHARRAVHLCPLQGEGYVYLAELAFLNSASADLKHALVDQALLVRPYSGLVLLAAGGEAALVGDNERALYLWKQAFRLDPDQQAQIIELLAPSTPADTFIEYFHPDRAALGKLFHFYRRHALAEPAKLAGLRYVAELEREAQHTDGPPAASLWGQAQDVYGFLGDTGQAADCARKAVFHSPDAFAVHQRLAAALLKNREYAEAVTQLQWCLSRRPQEASLRQQLEQANRQRLAPSDAIVR
jgi:tetratricopeptide (TPR) repeat protein